MTRLRLTLGVVATFVVLAPLAYFWQDSRMPSSYSVMEMGYVEAGGGPGDGHDHHGVSVAELTGPRTGVPDVRVELVAREQDGRFTFNEASPGPVIEAGLGQLVEVRVINESVGEGMTVHWHGLDVPNAEDGVAGVTQNAIASGQEHTYRFVADQVGTYWYHSHQVSHSQVQRGLFGTLVIYPPTRDDRLEVLAVSHTYGGVATLNGEEGTTTVDAPPGRVARVRVVNTDNSTVRVWTSDPYRVLAVDGYDVNGPTPASERLDLAAGGRLDLEVTAPARVQVGTSTALVVGDDPGEPEEPADELDLLSYGTPAPLPFDVSEPDRTFRYDIGRRPGFVNGKPGFWWSINGKLWPHVPMYLVDEGDVVVFRISNSSGDVHPMHLHGHHAVVLSREGNPATGSPWWVDSLDVKDGETMEVAFVADNPGIWMDHCHNLTHAAQGLVAHLMYSGVTAPYRLGDDSRNVPE